jgi:hypothetical protein
MDVFLPPWRQEGVGSTYTADPLYPKRVVLSERATVEVCELASDTEDKKPKYALIQFDGMLRAHNHLYRKWENVLKEAINENLVIFNGRNLKAMRVVWHKDFPLMRKLEQQTLEKVILVPYVPVLDQFKTRLTNRIFNTGDVDE